MSEFNRVSGAPREWPLRIVNSNIARIVACAIALGLLSLALSAVTSTSRAKLFLGPQTLVLGGVGLLVAILVFWCARYFSSVPDVALLDRPILTTGATFGVILVAILISLGIIYFAFATFPNSADEGGFLFQADTFRHGHLWNAPPPDPGLFAQNYIIARNGMWVSQYLPGWPAILALFELVHLPAWSAAAVCGGGLLLLLWAALRRECQPQALVVALLLAYATTDFFLLNAATYFSHCASAATVVGSIVCILQSERDASWRWPAAAGACFGAALLCRVDSAALVGIAALAGWIEQGCRRRTLLFGIIGALPLLIAFGAYNELITGNALLVPTAWAGNVSIGMHGLKGIERTEHFRMLVQTAWRLGELADTASLVIPVLYVAALIMRIRARRVRFYDVVPIANFIVFLIFPDLGGFQMGPRYWFDGFVVMHITIGSVFSQRPVAWSRFATACCLLLVPISLARLPALVRFESHMMSERSSVFRLAATLPANQRSIILIKDFYSTWNDRANRTAPNFAKDFVRNGISLDKPVLFARGNVPDALGRACTLYPHAAMFAFHLDQAHPDGWLAPLACG